MKRQKTRLGFLVLAGTLGIAGISWSAGAGASARHVSRPFAASHKAISRAANASPGQSGTDGPVINYANGLQASTSGWCTFAGGCNGANSTAYGTIDVLPATFSNYGGYGAKATKPVGNLYNAYARVSGSLDSLAGCTTGAGNENCSGPYIVYGGAAAPETVFPRYGFNTKIKVYIDAAWADANPWQVIDWDVALNSSTPTAFYNYLEDFAFNLCSTTAGTGGFYVSTSNGAGGCSSGPTELSTSGWYQFDHDFYFAGGALYVVYSIVNSSGITVYQTTQVVTTNPYTNAPIAASQLGGPDYGWFADEDALGLPVSWSYLTVNTALSNPVPPPVP